MSRFNEIEEAYELRESLISNNKGCILNEIFDGERIETCHGYCYLIEDRINLKLKTLNHETAASQLLMDLKLIPGIGEVREQLLNNEGYRNINELKDHPKYSKPANEFIDKFNQSDNLFIEHLTNYPKSHPNLLLTSCLNANNSDYLFFDIETLGLKNYPVILLGMGRIQDDELIFKQYLSASLTDEKAVLTNFLSDIDKDTILVSFNGRSFDLPFIKSRLSYYGIDADIGNNHLDLLHFSRRIWGDTLPNCRLQTIEQCLFNISRIDDVPSSLVPEFYKTYLETGNIGPLIPIVTHNRLDVMTLVKILSQLYEELA